MTVLAFQFSQQEELASTLFFPRKIYCCFQEFSLAVFLAGAMGLVLEPSDNPSFANLNNTELIFFEDNFQLALSQTQDLDKAADSILFYHSFYCLFTTNMPRRLSSILEALNDTLYPFYVSGEN